MTDFTVTHFGVALLVLLLVGVLSSLRLGGQRGQDWDVMSKWQRDRLMRERHAKNPALRSRR